MIRKEVKPKFLDRVWLGIILGLIGPIVGSIIYYFLQLNFIPFEVFLREIVAAPDRAAPLLSFGAIMNLIVFFIFIWTNHPLAARGVILSTFIYAAIVIFLKFIL